MPIARQPVKTPFDFELNKGIDWRSNLFYYQVQSYLDGGRLEVVLDEYEIPPSPINIIYVIKVSKLAVEVKHRLETAPSADEVLAVVT